MRMDALLSPPASLQSWKPVVPISFSKSRVPNVRELNGYSALDTDDDEISIEELVASAQKESRSSSYHQNLSCSEDSDDSVGTIVFEHHVNAIAGCQELGKEDEEQLIQLVVSELKDVPSRPPFETRRSSTRSRRSSSLSTSRRSSHRSSSLTDSTHHCSSSSLYSETGSLSPSSSRNGSRRRKSGSRRSIRRDPSNDGATSSRSSGRKSGSRRRSSANSIDTVATLSSGSSTPSHSRRRLRRSSMTSNDLPKQRPSSTHSRVTSSSRNRRKSERQKKERKQTHPSSEPTRGSRKYETDEECGSTRPNPEEVDETMPFRDRMIAILGIDESFLNSDDEGIL